MKKIAVSVIVVILMTFGFKFWYDNTFVVLKPLTFNNGFKRKSTNNIVIKGLSKVLKYYNIDFYKKNGDIYVKRKVANDRNLILNFTTKAQDNEWLRAH
jgi:hypothetical protein